MMLGWVDCGGGVGYWFSLVWDRVWQNQMAFGAEKGIISLKIDHCH